MTLVLRFKLQTSLQYTENVFKINRRKLLNGKILLNCPIATNPEKMPSLREFSASRLYNAGFCCLVSASFLHGRLCRAFCRCHRSHYLRCFLSVFRCFCAPYRSSFFYSLGHLSLSTEYTVVVTGNNCKFEPVFCRGIINADTRCNVSQRTAYRTHRFSHIILPMIRDL